MRTIIWNISASLLNVSGQILRRLIILVSVVSASFEDNSYHGLPQDASILISAIWKNLFNSSPSTSAFKEERLANFLLISFLIATRSLSMRAFLLSGFQFLKMKPNTATIASIFKSTPGKIANKSSSEPDSSPFSLANSTRRFSSYCALTPEVHQPNVCFVILGPTLIESDGLIGSSNGSIFPS